MIQLILDLSGNSLVMPESRKGGYSVQSTPLTEDVGMISGRTTREARGNVWTISCQNGFFDETNKNKFISICEKGTKQSIECSFLIPENNEMKTSRFLVTSFRRPRFMWSKLGTENGAKTESPVWGDYFVELREVKPHA